MGPTLATVSSTEISPGVKPVPAFVGRNRLEILFTAARNRGAKLTTSLSSVTDGLPVRTPNLLI